MNRIAHRCAIVLLGVAGMLVAFGARAVAPIPPMLDAAKLIEVVTTGATVDLAAVVADASLGATMQGGYAVFDKPLSEYLPVESTYSGVSGQSTTSATVRVVVSADGRFWLGTIAATPSEHLTVFGGMGGLKNYYDFSGNLLDPSVYGTPQGIALNLDERTNMLGYAFGEIYKGLYNAGSVPSGPANFAELWNAGYSMVNRFAQPIQVIESHLHHEQFDFSWYPAIERPLDEVVEVSGGRTVARISPYDGRGIQGRRGTRL